MLRYFLLVVVMHTGRAVLRGTQYFGCWKDDIDRDLDGYSLIDHEVACIHSVMMMTQVFGEKDLDDREV